MVRGEAIVGHVPGRKYQFSLDPWTLYLTLGRLGRLSSNRIQSLLWGFSARPSLLLIDLKLFCAPRGRIEVSESNFAWKNFRSLNFRTFEFYVKYAKFCTIRKFLAIRYELYLILRINHIHDPWLILYVC